MNKKIIIDGVDVSKCCLRRGNYCEPHMEYEFLCSCKDYPDCDYKQLQRKTEDYNKISILLRNTNTYSEVCDTCKDEILIYPSISGKTSYTDNEVEIITLTKIINELKRKTAECEKYEQALLRIRRLELDELDIDFDEYITHVRETDYSPILTEVAKVLGDIEDD